MDKKSLIYSENLSVGRYVGDDTFNGKGIYFVGDSKLFTEYTQFSQLFSQGRHIFRRRYFSGKTQFSGDMCMGEKIERLLWTVFHQNHFLGAHSQTPFLLVLQVFGNNKKTVTQLKNKTYFCKMKNISILK